MPTQSFSKYHLPGKEISCQPLGSVRDCKLCTIWSSNGKGGWKKSADIIASRLDESALLFAATDAAASRANGSVGPIGAKLSNDNADSVGGGESELFVTGEGWLYTGGRSKVLEAGVCEADDRGTRFLTRGKEAFEETPGDNGSSLAIGLASSFSKKREYSFGPWRSSIATSGDPRRSMTFWTRARISTRVSGVRYSANLG